MKLTLNHYLNFLALFLIAILFLLYLKSSKSSSVAVTSDASQAKLGTRVAYVNSDSLYANYSKFKNLEKDLESSGQSAQQNLQKKMQGLQAQYESLVKKAQSGQITPQQAQAEEQALMKKKQQLDAESQQMIGTVQEKSQKAAQEIKAELFDYFQKNKSKYNCDLVISYQSNGNLLYFDTTQDITKKVLEDLNQK
ncbi:MAG: OmpH family outer membrane protein [Chitinophagales bacterium]|jgi:outer membrane protein|nr:OmpH family outer membrane protein [Chitinophagales bacterium]